MKYFMTRELIIAGIRLDKRSCGMKITIGVSGHRDLVESEIPGLREKLREFFDQLKNKFPDLELQLISPLAEGSDQLVAAYAIERGIPVIAPLPMPLAEYEKDFTQPEALNQFRELLVRSEIINLPLLGETRVEDLAHDPNARNLQYAQQGIFISNHCQILLALWDGKFLEQLGGTSDVVNYHLTAIMSGYPDADETPNILADNENDLVYHIVCSRQSHTAETQLEFQPLHTSWITSHFRRSDHLPYDSELTFSRLHKFGSDIQRYEKQIEKHQRGLLPLETGLEIPDGIPLVDQLFCQADALAIHFQKLVMRGLFALHLLAVLMGLAFIVYSELGAPEILLHSFLLFFVIAAGVNIYGNKKQWHRRYLDYRALAEGLRVQFYWNLSAVVKTETAVFAYDNFLQKQDVDLAWIRHVMRAASLRRDRSERPDDTWVQWVIDQWIGDEEKSGQLAYYINKSREKASNFKRTSRFGSVCLWAGIGLTVVLAFSAAGWISSGHRHVLMIFIGLLPLIAGVRDAYSHKKAEKELIKQYRFMESVFSNARTLLDKTDDLEFKRKVLKAVGDAALEEHAEWILMHRERPLDQGGL